MGQRSAKLRKLLTQSRRTADQAQKAFLRVEDQLSALEDREQRRADREPRPRLPGR